MKRKAAVVAIKRIRDILLLIVAATVLSGCGVAMLTAAAVWGGKVAAEDRQAFAEINTEREKAGLEPLTWEEYRKHKPKEDQP